MVHRARSDAGRDQPLHRPGGRLGVRVTARPRREATVAVLRGADVRDRAPAGGRCATRKRLECGAGVVDVSLVAGQEESLYCERLKHTGELPLIGVNTYPPKEGQGEQIDKLELMRSTEAEKLDQIANLRAFQDRAADRRPAVLAHLQQVARDRGNVFEALMDAVKVASLGQISGALYDVGGEYRRNM